MAAHLLDSRSALAPTKGPPMNRSRVLINHILILLALVTISSPATTVVAQQPKPKRGSVKATVRPVKEYSIEQFMNTTRIGGSSFSADEKSILFSGNKTGIFN